MGLQFFIKKEKTMSEKKSFNWKGNIKVYMVANAMIGHEISFSKGEFYSINDDTLKLIGKSCMLEKEYNKLKNKALTSANYSNK